jgi:hypothetical protein
MMNVATEEKNKSKNYYKHERFDNTFHLISLYQRPPTFFNALFFLCNCIRLVTVDCTDDKIDSKCFAKKSNCKLNRFENGKLK